MKRNRLKFKRFEKDLEKLSKQVIQIGAVGQHDEAEMPNADLLAIHEFGTDDGHIPPRAPIRKTFRDKSNLKLISNNIQNLMKQNYNSSRGTFSIGKIVDGVGLTMQQLVKAAFIRRLSPRNVDVTLAQKRGDLPLIDQRQLLNSIQFGVRQT